MSTDLAAKGLKPVHPGMLSHWSDTQGCWCSHDLRRGIAVHVQRQQVYYGEYLNGHQRAIRVARVNVASRRVEVCWTFQRCEIKHIHAIHCDRFRSRLWVCAGELDHEFTDGTAMSQKAFGPRRPQYTLEEPALAVRGHDCQWRRCLGLPHAIKSRQGVGRYSSIRESQGISPAGQVLCPPVKCQAGSCTLMKFRWPAHPELPT